MNYLEFDRHLKNDELKNIYFFHGEEKYLLELMIKKLKEKFEKQYDKLETGINYIKLNSKNIDNLEDEINMIAFGYDKKLILIEDLNVSKNLTQKQLDILNNYSNCSDQSCIVIIKENEIDKRTANFKKIKNLVFEIEAKELSFDQLVSFMSKYFAKHNANIANGTIVFLIEYIGNSLYDLISESDKLISYTTSKEVIDENLIRKLANQKIELMIFDLTNAMTKNESNEKIFQIYLSLIDSKEPQVLILSTLYNHFKKIYKTKIALLDNENVAQILDLKPNQLFLVAKYTAIANSKPMKYWKNILKYLQDLDYNYKIGNIELIDGLDSFVSLYCLK